MRRREGRERPQLTSVCVCVCVRVFRVNGVNEKECSDTCNYGRVMGVGEDRIKKRVASSGVATNFRVGGRGHDLKT